MTTPLPRPARRRSDGIGIGRIGGIPIVLSWSWLASVVVIVLLAAPVVVDAVPDVGQGTAIGVGVVLAVLLGVSVLVHELGHVWAARLLGLPVIDVRLYLLGGATALGRQPSSPREEAVIAGAGPALSALLSGLFFLVAGATEPHTVTWLVVGELAFSNAVVAVFNVLPALPLDGGRVLRAGVWKMAGRRRIGTLAASAGGYLVALALLVWAVVVFGHSTRGGLLQAAFAVATAAFVALGAYEEQKEDRRVDWPVNLPLTALARPVVELPAEVGVGLALQAAAGRAVLLAHATGVSAGLLDERAAADLARRDPRAAAVDAAVAVPPECLVLPGETPEQVVARTRMRPDAPLLLVDDDGRPVGAIEGDRWARAVADHESASTWRP